MGDSCRIAEKAVEIMRAGVHKYRRLFTYDGVLDEVELFAKSSGVSSWLRCEPLGPRANVDYFKQRMIRPALRCAVAEGAHSRDDCMPNDT